MFQQIEDLYDHLSDVASILLLFDFFLNILDRNWRFCFRRIVRSYLLHYGYQDTLKSFDLASENTYPSESMAQENGFDDQGDMYALDHRNILRQVGSYILGGYFRL